MRIVMSMPDEALRLLRAYLGPMQEAVVGALPEDPKVDIPLPAGSTLVGSITSRHGPTVTAYIESALEPQELLAFYESEYAARGWRAQAPAMWSMGGGGYGFMSSQAPTATPEMRVFCKSELEPYYRLQLLPDQPRVRVSWHAAAEGMPHPCSTEPPERRMHGPSADAMPRLEGPPGVAVRGGGGGGGGDEWSTYGSALTNMPAGDLMEHFVTTIADQGHELLERGTAERVAWSRWRMKKKGWEGFLSVIEQRPDVRHLTFLTYTERAIENIRQWQAFSTGWSSRRYPGG